MSTPATTTLAKRWCSSNVRTPSKPRSLSAVEALQRAGRDDLAATLLQRGERTDKVVAMIVMPASVDYDRPLSSCAEEVAGDEIGVP